MVACLCGQATVRILRRKLHLSVTDVAINFTT